MSISFTVDADRAAISEAISLFEFVGGNSADAMRVAINKAGPKVKTLSSQTIRGQVNLKAGYVGKRLTFTRATKSKPSAVIKTPSRGLLLSRFSTDSQISSDNISWIKPPPVPARGIRVKVKPGSSPKPVTGDQDTTGKPFYIVLKNSGAIGIAARRASGSGIKVFHGPSLSQVFSSVRDDILPASGKELQDQLLDAMRFLLTKKYPVE